MKLAVCHYSYHRTWIEKEWDCIDLAEAVKTLGVDGVDFHVRYLGVPDKAAIVVQKALDATGLEISGLSMSNEFNRVENKAQLREQIVSTKRWLALAAELKSPVSRIFGGHIENRTDKQSLEEGTRRIIDVLSEVAEEAEKLGVIIALENHGGLPCSAEEQVSVIEAVNSPNLRATSDVGNYMQCGQEGHDAVRIVAPYIDYVHFKDFRKIYSNKNPWGWEIEPTVVGEGDVDHRRCLRELAKADYSGFIALEYEAEENEELAVKKSVDYMKMVVDEIAVEENVAV